MGAKTKTGFGIDIETCSLCGGVVKITALTHPCVRGISASMHVIASIEDPAVAVKILSHLEKKNKDPDKVNLPESRAPPHFAFLNQQIKIF